MEPFLNWTLREFTPLTHILYVCCTHRYTDTHCIHKYWMDTHARAHTGIQLIEFFNEFEKISTKNLCFSDFLSTVVNFHNDLSFLHEND